MTQYLQGIRVGRKAWKSDHELIVDGKDLRDRVIRLAYQACQASQTDLFEIRCQSYGLLSESQVAGDCDTIFAGHGHDRATIEFHWGAHDWCVCVCVFVSVSV